MMTKRDIEILKFINDFGFCVMPQIEKKFGVKKPRSYQIMKRLVDAGVVMHERILQNQHGVFYLTRKGAAFTELSPIKNISLGNYRHQLMVIDVYLKLMQQYPDAYWISERYLFREKFENRRLRERGHVADGMLVLPDQKQIAIEVELTLKGERRLDKILKGYASEFLIKEVWYFCSSKILRKVNKIANRLGFVKVYNVDEFLGVNVAHIKKLVAM